MNLDDRPTLLARRRRRLRRYRGYGMAELALSLILLTAAMAVSVKAVAWVASERAGAERRRWVTTELSNAMERIVSEPFDQVTAERAKAVVASLPITRNLHGAEVEAEVKDDAAGPIDSRRVRLRVRWKGRSGDWDAPVSITAWVSRRRAAT